MSVDQTGVLGFQLHADGTEIVRRHERPFTVLGHLHSREEFLVAEDAVDGSVWVFSADLSTAWPLNASRSALDACLAAFERYLADGPEIFGPVVVSAEEMRERLDRLARGEVSPRKTPKRTVSHRVRMKRLRQDVRSADRSALTSESWWSGVMEEAENDLI